MVLDCDGVLFRGDDAIPGAQDAVRALWASSQVFMVTNNSRLSVADLARKLTRLNFEFKEENLWTSVRACAACVHADKAFVIGSQALKDALASKMELVTPQGLLDPVEARAVIVGFDSNFCYRDMAYATRAILENDASFIATNRDFQYPAGGCVLPGNGALVASIVEATRKEPLVTGKPSPFMLDRIFEQAHVQDPASVLVVGDMWSDIAFGKRCATALVLTGVAKMGDVRTWEEKPDVVLPSIVDIVSYVERRL